MTSRHIVISEDGSPTIWSDDFGQCYHSTAGAVMESEYLFIDSGLKTMVSKRAGSISILEYGFGTGLNALLTALATCKEPWMEGREIRYTTLELYPLTPEEYKAIDYSKGDTLAASLYDKIHTSKWSTVSKREFTEITPKFSICKIKCDFEEYIPERQNFDLVYFDAFSPESQPQSWSEKIFRTLHNGMKEYGMIITYSSKGSVKQAMRAAGFLVKRIPGAGKKRHSLTAVKIPEDRTEILPQGQ